MRILFVCDHFPTYGTKSVLTLAKTLAARGHRVVVASTSVGMDGAKLSNKSSWSFPVIRYCSIPIPAIPYTYTPFAASSLRSLANQFKPDIIHTHFLMYWLSLQSHHLASDKWPVVLTLHGFTLPDEPLNWPSGLALDCLYKTVGATLVNSVSRLLFVSEQVEQKFSLVYPSIACPTELMPIGINPLSLTGTMTKTREEVRASLGLHNKRVFIFLGRVVKDKGMRELAAAYKRLRKELNNVALLVVGDGEFLMRFKELTSNIPDVKTVGFRQDIGSYLNAADIFVLPSYREGFPTALIEAMFFGLPFIVTPTGGTSDVMKLGAKGSIVDIGSIYALYNEMRALATMDSSELKEMGENNRQLVEKHLNWDVLLDRLIRIYECTIEEHNGRHLKGS